MHLPPAHFRVRFFPCHALFSRAVATRAKPIGASGNCRQAAPADNSSPTAYLAVSRHAAAARCGRVGRRRSRQLFSCLCPFYSLRASLILVYAVLFQFPRLWHDCQLFYYPPLKKKLTKIIIIESDGIFQLFRKCFGSGPLKKSPDVVSLCVVASQRPLRELGPM